MATAPGIASAVREANPCQTTDSRAPVKRLFLLAVLTTSLFVARGTVWSTAAFPVVRAQADDAARDAWQQPERVMDALGIRSGSRVADVGCGEGYFTVRLARRVGAEGIVYAVDIDEGALGRLRRRVENEGFGNVQIIRSKKDDPLLPAGALDVVLIVNAYHEMREYDAMLGHIYAGLKPGGLLGIIDAPGKEADERGEHQREHTISRNMVREDAARNAFRFRGEEPGFPHPEGSRGNWFFLVFEKARD